MANNPSDSVDNGRGPYTPLPPHIVRDIAVGGVTARAFSMPLARELLHLRERTATLELQLSELETANSRLEGDVIDLHEDNAGLVKQNLDLHEKIDDWKAACGLNDASGDPGGIEPRHLVRRIWEDHRRYSLLLRDLDAVRKVYASTSMARDAAAAKVVVMERLEVWLHEETCRAVRVIMRKDDLAVDLLPRHPGPIFSGFSQTLLLAIDAALREVEA